MKGHTIQTRRGRHSPRMRQRGLTVIELMLTLSVIAVVASLAVPSFSDLIQRQRIVAAANQLVAGINLTRQRAVMDNAITRICPSVSGLDCDAGNRWDRGWIIFRDPNNQRRPESPELVLHVGAPLDELHSDSAGRTGIRYLPSGFATGTNLTIKLCDPHNPDNARAVIVSNSGRARVADLPDHLSCPGA